MSRNRPSLAISRVAHARPVEPPPGGHAAASRTVDSDEAPQGRARAGQREDRQPRVRSLPHAAVAESGRRDRGRALPGRQAVRQRAGARRGHLAGDPRAALPSSRSRNPTWSSPSTPSGASSRVSWASPSSCPTRATTRGTGSSPSRAWACRAGSACPSSRCWPRALLVGRPAGQAPPGDRARWGRGIATVPLADAIRAWIRGLKNAVTGAIESERPHIERLTILLEDPRMMEAAQTAIFARSTSSRTAAGWRSCSTPFTDASSSSIAREGFERDEQELDEGAQPGAISASSQERDSGAAAHAGDARPGREFLSTSER